MNQASSSTVNFVSKLKTLAANIATNVGIMLLINGAIKLLAKAWDTFNITVEEQEAKIEELKSSYEGLKSEYDELSQKQDVTDAEKRRLEYLERRLELDERILKAEQAQLFDEKTGSKFTDYFDKDNLNTQYKQETANQVLASLFSGKLLGFRNKDGFDSISNFYDKKTSSIENIREQIEAWKEYQSNVEEGSEVWNAYQSAIDKVQEKETQYIDQLSEKENQLTINLGKYADNIESMQEALDSGYLNADQTATAQEQIDLWTDLYNKTQSMIASIQELNGTYESTLSILDQINEKYGGGYSDDPITEGNRTQEQKNFRDFSSGLSVEDQEIVNTEEYDIALQKVIESLNGAELSAEDYAKALEKVKEEQEIIAESSDGFNISTYKDQIDDIQSAISTLRSALDSFNEGTLDEDTILDLMQQFPELIPYVDLAADGFGNLSEGLGRLIEQQPNSLISSLQSLKEYLNTDEERAQVDALINSLQDLSSYGDTGTEAYAASIGSTWNDTANVIETVISQFENLAKVQEAVADGLTMSATAAAELAKMYPEILDHAQVTANGQITLNEEVVQSILNGDKSIVDAQIAKLEADKAELTAKKSYAEAQLNIIKQVAEGEGNITKEVAQYRLDIANELLHTLIEAGLEEDKAYAAVAANMAGNMNEYNRIVGEVAQDTSVNMDAAAVSMANSININSINAQKSFSNLQQKVWDLADSVKAAANGERAGGSGIYGGGGSTSSGGIKARNHSGNFNTAITNYTAKDFNLSDFQSQLEIDIKGYTDAISNIDSQIEILKNLQASFENNGGIGGHGYKDKIKQLEKEKDALNKATKDSTSSAKDEFDDTIDFFERRVKVLQDSFSNLEKGMSNVFGADAKNALVTAQIGIVDEQIDNYTDALAMYRQKANDALSGVDSDLRDKIVNGAVQITDFIGKGNEEVVEAMEAYKGWADKVADCTQKLEELKTQIRQLELQKFNNIMEEFQNQFDLRGDSIDLIKKQIGLLEEAGELIGENFYSKQIEQSQKQLNILETEKTHLVQQLEDALASGRVKCCPTPQ